MKYLWSAEKLTAIKWSMPVTGTCDRLDSTKLEDFEAFKSILLTKKTWRDLRNFKIISSKLKMMIGSPEFSR